jgi:hypothetical protein
LLFGVLASLPVPRYLTAWKVPMIVNGNTTQQSFATLSTSCEFSFYSSDVYAGFYLDQPSTIFPAVLQYET